MISFDIRKDNYVSIYSIIYKNTCNL